MKYRVTHLTSYEAGERVSVCHNMARLAPRRTAFQNCLSHRLSIAPAESTRSTRVDTFGNHVTFFSSNTGYLKLDVKAVSLVEVAGRFPDETVLSPSWKSLTNVGAKMSGHPENWLDAVQYIYQSPRIHTDPAFAEYGQTSFSEGRPILEAVRDLTHRIHTDFEYDPTATTVSTPVREVFEHRKGVCQDFAHLQIAILRSMGIPTRYVSGYIRTYAAANGEALVGAAASHAWLSVFTGDETLGDAGWVDVDPTNDKFLTDEYVTVAWGRDYSDVTPLKGVYTGGGHHTLAVSVDVAPLD